MAAPDSVLTQFASRFPHFEVIKNRAGYSLRDRHSGAPVARLKRFTDSDNFELFYWNTGNERWRTFGPFGRMPLTLDEVFEILENESLFRRRRPSLLRRIFR